jgi:hypothetical protein
MPDPWFEERAVRRTAGHRVVERLRNLPGVEAAGATLRMPVAGARIEMAVLPAELPIGEVAPPVAVFSAITPGFLDASGIPLLEGRDFAQADDGRLPVALVSASLARRLWPGRSPVGLRLRIGQTRSSFAVDGVPVTVVGVVGDIRHEGWLGNEQMAVYVPWDQFPAWYASVLLRVREGAAPPPARAVRAALRDVHPQLLVTRISPVAELLQESVARERLLSRLFTVFSGAALALAAVGSFGLVFFLVRRRTREIGVRIALGQPPATTVRTVIGWGLRSALVGVMAGLIVVVAAGRAIGGLLFGVTAFQPSTLSACAFVLLVVTIMATAAPAVRAARIGPLRALRND